MTPTLSLSRFPTDIAFDSAVTVLAHAPGFVAIDGRGAVGRDGRFSVVAKAPTRTFRLAGGFIITDGHPTIDTPAEALARFFEETARFPYDANLPFSGGAIGFVGFEGAAALRGFEPAQGFSRLPQCQFGIYDTAFVFDHAEGTASIVVAASSEYAARRRALVLEDEVNSWRPPAGPESFDPLAAQEIRSFPDTNTLRGLAHDAHSWVRSEVLSHVHLVRHRETPADARSIVASFLQASSSGSVRALFMHEGAGFILESGEGAVRAYGDHAECTASFIGQFPSAALTGAPLDRAYTFLHRHESTHRQFYGGGFGCVEKGACSFRTTQRAEIFADGLKRTTSGVDLTASSDPAQCWVIS